MSNLMYKFIMVKLQVALTLIEFEKTTRNTFKVYYGGVFISRQSLISLNNKVLARLYGLGVFSYVDGTNYNPDFFQMSYSGLVTSLRYMLGEFLKTLNSDDSNDIVSYNHYKEVLYE